MVGWLLNVVYLLLILAASPLLVWRAASQGKYRTGWGEKFLGRLPKSLDGEQVVWLHAVSVGEVLQLRTLVAGLKTRQPDLTILITTTTATGHAVATETFPDCRVAYCPLDFTWAVKQALRRVRPVILGLVELELWPNLIRETASADAPLILINGRMSEQSYRGYRRVKPLIASLLSRFHAIAVQSDQYAERIIDLGANASRVHVTGSIKFDGVNVDGCRAQSDELCQAFGIRDEETVFVAGSTHAPEEEHALDTWQALRDEFPELRLILVPRHQERFNEVAAMIESRGGRISRRSAPDRGVADEAVCLLDTLGELTACWGLADVAFVGGSLTRRGGQNMIEPAAHGVPIIVGPNTSNFQDIVEGLVTVDGIEVIDSADELTAAVRSLLSRRIKAGRQARAAREFVECQQGATGRTVELLLPLLRGRSTRGEFRAAS